MMLMIQFILLSNVLRPKAWVEEGTPYRRSKGSPTKGATKQERHKQSK